MKKDLHPKFYSDATISCACGATYKTGSTKEAIAIELCANCHPFYTGEQKIVDTARRVEKFTKRAENKATEADFGAKAKAAKKAARAEKRAAKERTGEK